MAAAERLGEAGALCKRLAPMGYYVVSIGGAAPRVVTSWSAAKEATFRVPHSWCKRYATKGDADSAAAGVASAPSDPEPGSQDDVFVDGAARLGERSSAAVFFGPGDPRNAAAPCAGPHTAPRAELEAVLLALRRGARDCTLWSDSSFAVAAVAEGFPEAWAHQDLLRALKVQLRDAGVRVRKVKGHSGVAGNDSAHRLAREALLASG